MIASPAQERLGSSASLSKVLGLGRMRLVLERNVSPRAGTHIRRRLSISGLEGAIEVAEVAEACRIGDAADRPSTECAVVEAAMDQLQPFAQHELRKGDAGFGEQDLHVARAQPLGGGGGSDAQRRVRETAHRPVLDRMEAGSPQAAAARNVPAIAGRSECERDKVADVY